MSNQKIIAFSARKQGGKTTAVNYLNEVFTKNHRAVEIISFAGPLKDFVQEYFCPGDWRERTQDEDFIENNKNTMLSCGKTVREVLQIVGTGWFRILDPDYWVRQWKVAVLQSRAEIILCGDVRFLNEIQAIQSLGGKVCRLTRNPFPHDKHASETALDRVGGVWDWFMYNSEMSIDEQNLETAILMQRWYPEFVPLFNGEQNEVFDYVPLRKRH